ncbi:MAG: hypothetical protein Q9195_008715 [Heterodermia aff. obscurata]
MPRDTRRQLPTQNTDDSNLCPSTVLFGYIGDRFPSRRTPFILGLILVFLSTLLFALATDLWTLLTARILEGFSTAIVHTVGYTLLTEVVGVEHLGKATGYTSMALSFGLLLGPVLGGVLYEYCGYFQVFLPAFGLIAMEIILRMMIIEKEKKPIPLPPQSSSSTTAAQKDPLKDEILSGAASHPRELDPLLQQPATTQPANAYKALLTSPRFLMALIALLILNSIANGFDSTLVPYIQDAFHMPATQAAALFLALAVPMLLAPISGWLTDRYGARLPILSGLTLAVPSQILLSLVSKGAAMPLLKLAVLLAIMGLTFALAMAPLGVEANFVVDDMEKEIPGRFGSHGILARAIGLKNTVIAAGGFAGPLYAGFVRVSAGWRFLQLLNAGLCAGILVSFLLSTGGSKRKETQDVETGA